MAILCVGYDVESDQSRTTRHFLKEMQRIHEDRGAPCSLFIKGRTLEKNVEQFKNLLDNDLFDMQQHTYSHLIFKHIPVIIDGKLQPVGEDEPLFKIQEEIERTQELFKNLLSLDVKGLTTPYAFYKGLSDRPDILKVLHDAGIRFIRSYARNEKSYNPVPLDVQPFFYEEQGFPDMLECPIQGWQDCIWRDRFGWNANWEKQVFMYIDHIVENDLYYGLAQHDWSSIKADKRMERTAAMLDYALEKEVQIIHYKDLYALKRGSN
ncbi:MAG: polysaccharide deacetylase family protein [Candidatus Hodarchaeota archaeon]